MVEIVLFRLNFFIIKEKCCEFRFNHSGFQQISKTFMGNPICWFCFCGIWKNFNRCCSYFESVFNRAFNGSSGLVFKRKDRISTSQRVERSFENESRPRIPIKIVGKKKLSTIRLKANVGFILPSRPKHTQKNLG